MTKKSESKKEHQDRPRTAQWLPAAADVRGNLVRIIAIALLFGVHLLNVYLPAIEMGSVRAAIGLGQQTVSASVHLSVCVVVFAWLMQALAIHLSVMTSPLSRPMAIVAVAGDSIWLSAALSFSTGASGPLVVGYFLIIALASLRLDLSLIRWATLFSVVGYLFVIGATRWPIGLLKQIGLEPVPRYHQLMTIIALGLMGMVSGQTIRLAWAMVAAHVGAQQEAVKDSHE